MLPGVEIVLHRAYLVTCGRVKLEPRQRASLYLFNLFKYLYINLTVHRYTDHIWRNMYTREDG